MSAASNDRNTAIDTEERIYSALRKTLEAFFEGHGTSPQKREASLRRVLKEFAPMPASKAPNSKVKIATSSDINRMWAAHEKAQRKTKK